VFSSGRWLQPTLIAILGVFVFASSARAAFFDNWDYEAHKWRTNAIISGGTVSDSTYLTVTRFGLQIKWWGLRPCIKRANLYCGGNTNSCFTPYLWDWTGTAINDDAIAFVAADYSESTGLKGNGLTKYLRVSKGGGLALNSVANGTNIHLATYVRTGSNEASDCSGVSDAGTGTTFALAISNSGNTYVFMGSSVTSTLNTNAIGFFLSTRNATTNGVTYQNTTNIVTDTSANTVTLPPEAYMMHAINVGGSVVAHTSRALSYYALGTAIPPSLVAPYNIAVQNVQIALGRNVP
jgi:hypothetical protein